GAAPPAARAGWPAAPATRRRMAGADPKFSCPPPEIDELLEHEPQAATRVMQPCLDRADRTTGPFCDLAAGIAVVIRQLERLAVLTRQLHEPVFEIVIEIVRALAPNALLAAAMVPELLLAPPTLAR